VTISVKPVPADLTGIILRPADEAECNAAGMTGHEAIAYSAASSIESYMVEIDGEPVAFWGYGARSFTAPMASAWLLTTVHADKHGKRLAKSSRRVIEYILEKFPSILVEVHQDHTVSCRWLEWLGFRLHASLPSGFHLMTIRRA
jgi:hypothetical protein